jgi:site-specific DNA-methyltransferase (adenine-specific)
MTKIAKIERVPYKGWLYGLEVEGDESFVANGIVVHNCEEGVNPEAKFAVISKALRETETVQGIPVIRRGRVPSSMAISKLSSPYRLLHGDSEEVLKTLPANLVDCVVTSPSYWGPKMTGLGKGELGGEAEVAPYISKLVAIFGETRRVLKDTGSIWIILGNGAHEDPNLDVPGLLSKGLQADGWALQSRRVWEKGKTNRDSVMQFSKRGHDCHLNAEQGTLPDVIQLERQASTMTAGSRFLQFPAKLGELVIQLSCPSGGVVMDPFVGTGVMLEAAMSMGRSAIGIDIDAGELRIASRRLGGRGLPYGNQIHKDLALSDAPAAGVNVGDLMRYFGAFKSLFRMYHNTGGLDVVLYDPVTGEVVMEDDDEPEEGGSWEQ